MAISVQMIQPLGPFRDHAQLLPKFATTMHHGGFASWRYRHRHFERLHRLTLSTAGRGGGDAGLGETLSIPTGLMWLVSRRFEQNPLQVDAGVVVVL